MDRDERRQKCAEEAQAKLQGKVDVMLDKIWECHETRQLCGDRVLAHALGLKWPEGKLHVQETSRQAIRDLMTPVREQFPRRYPGFSVTRPGGGVVQVTDDSDDRQNNREAVAALRSHHTKGRRFLAQTEPWRTVGDPLQRAARELVEASFLVQEKQETLIREVMAVRPGDGPNHNTA